MTIRLATSAADLAAIQRLFQTYAESLNIDLAFQRFAAELASLPGSYASPKGALFLAEHADAGAIGCVGVRPLALDGSCEMKRLYVQPSARGTGLGRALAQQAILFAQTADYANIVLDTLPSMTGAHGLYQSLGFQRIPAYYDNPVPHALYFRKQLSHRLTDQEPE